MAANANLIRDLEHLLGPAGVLSRTEDLLLYEYDGSVEEARPDCVVFPAPQAGRRRNRKAGQPL